MSREMTKKLKGLGGTLSEGFPHARDGVLPSRSIPMAHPFWEWHPWLDWVASLANSGAWDVVIVGKFIFSPSRGTPGLHQGAPLPSNPSWRIPIRGKPLFPPDHAAFLPPGCPFPSIISRRMFIRGKCSPRLFPFPATYPGRFATPPLFVPLCMHLFIANILNL